MRVVTGAAIAARHAGDHVMATTRIDTDFEGNLGLDMYNLGLTGNGRYLMFESDEGAAALGDDQAGRVFIRDMDTGETTVGAITLSGAAVDDAYGAQLSQDGRYVTYTSARGDIVAGDTNNAIDVFRYDRQTGTTMMISRAPGGAVMNAQSETMRMSPDGNIIIYCSYGNATGDTSGVPGWLNMFMFNAETGVTTKLTDDNLDGGATSAWYVWDVDNDGDYSSLVALYDAGGKYLGGTGLQVGGRRDTWNLFSNDASQEVQFNDHMVLGTRADLASDPNAWRTAPARDVSSIVLADEGQFVAYYTSLPSDLSMESSAGLWVFDFINSTDNFEGRKVAQVAKGMVTDVAISANGRWITYHFTAQAADPGKPTGVYRVENPLWTGSDEDGEFEPNLNATGEADLLYGTSGNDVIHALGGNDQVRGAGGKDEIHGGTGEDRLWGGSGNDEIYGGAEKDEIDGGSGDDKLWGDYGDQQQGGDDLIWGGLGKDEIHGEAGKDTLYGGQDDDKLWGDAGNDKLWGGDGKDTLYGGADQDELRGEGADDILWGQEGDDQLWGAGGKDEIHGGTGNDVIHIDADGANDMIDGGSDGDGKDVDVVMLEGSAEDYDLDDTFTTLDGLTVRATSVSSDATGFDIVAHVEQARFETLRTNVADPLNTYVVLAEAANHAYKETAALGLGWKPLSALELGIRGEGFIGDSATSWTYENGHFSAIGPAAGTGHPVEAVAQIYFGVFEGKNTLMVAIRGTDSISDAQDYPQFQWHYDRFAPLIDAVVDYVNDGGHTETGTIDRVLVAGHSLGGATVQQMMHDSRIFGDPRYLAATFGSPGSEANAYDPRIVHFEHTADIVPLAGDAARGVAGSIVGDLDLFAPGSGGMLQAFLDGTANPTHFRGAGDAVRIDTSNAVAPHALGQHSMTNYVASLHQMARHPEAFPVLTQGTAGIPGDGGKIDIALGTDNADFLIGAWAWIADGLRGPNYFDGSERFFGGKGADYLEGGSGRDRFEGSLTELNGDFIADLAGGESIRVWGGSTIDDVHVGYRYDEDAGRGVLTVAGAEIYLGGEHDGAFVVHKGDGYSDILYTGRILLSGSDKGDVVSGGDGDDVVAGGAGNDRLIGGKGTDQLFGGARGGGALRAANDGDDVLDGGEGADVLTGGSGRDRFIVGLDAADRVTDFVVGTQGDSIDVSAVIADGGLIGNPFASGHLTLVAGEAGDTWLMYHRAGGGAGPGERIMILDGVAPGDLVAANVVAGGTPIDPWPAAAPILGSGGNDLLIGTEAGEVIVSNGGYDIIQGRGGHDTIHLGRRDPSDPDGPAAPIPDDYEGRLGADGGEGNDTIIGGPGYGWLWGGAGDDRIEAADYDYVYGEAGDDTIVVRRDGVHADGGTGADTFVIGTVAHAGVFDFTLGEDRLDLSLHAGVTAFEQVDWKRQFDGFVQLGIEIGGVAIVGDSPIRVGDVGASDFVFAAGPQSGVVRGTAAADTLVSANLDAALDELFRLDAGGSDTAAGGAGRDRFYLGAALDAGDRIDGGAGHNDIMLQGDYAGDRAVALDGVRFAGIENVVLLSGSDRRFGASGTERFSYDLSIAGGAGAGEPVLGLSHLTIDGAMLRADETLVVDASGLAVTDGLQMLGGEGDDRLTGGFGENLLDGGHGDDVLDIGRGYGTLAGGWGKDTLIGSATMRVTLYGGFGDDIYRVHGKTTIIEAQGNGNDTLHADADFTLTAGAHVETLIVDTAAGIILAGNEIANRIVGNVGADRLEGHGGDDVLVGGGGADVLDGGTGNDRYVVTDSATQVIEAIGGGSDDRVLTSVDFVLAAGAEVERLTVVSADGRAITGNEFANCLTGGAGNDRLDGGTGADTLAGGRGDDLYVIEDAGDRIIERVGAGHDTVETVLDRYRLGAALEDLLYLGTGDFIGIGNAQDNRITGGAGSDRLTGNAGDDVLIGGGGADVLIGGTGADRMTGGADADRFAFLSLGDLTHGDRHDTILDFSHAEGDRIDLRKIDADVIAAGDQNFTFIGMAAFTGMAGELRVEPVSDVALVHGDVDGDGVADFTIDVLGAATLVRADFIL